MSWTGVITDAGARLLEAWMGESTLHVLETAGAGSGLAAGALESQTDLADRRQTVSIVAREHLDTGYRVSLQITAPETGYDLQQIGVFARLDEGEQVLFALYQNDKPVPIPSRSESPDFAYTFHGFLAVSNEGQLEIHLDSAVWAKLENGKIPTSQLPTGLVTHDTGEPLPGEHIQLNADLLDGHSSDWYATAAGLSAANEALARKADRDAVNEALGKKADQAAMTEALGKKADQQALEEGLASMTEELTAKADQDTVEAALALKANQDDMEAGLAEKANQDDMEAGLAEKANQDALEAGLAQCQPKATMLTVTLSASGWGAEDSAQTVDAPGISADETAQLILPTPAQADQHDYYAAGVRLTGQGAGSLTFTAEATPGGDLTVYVAVLSLEVGE